MKNSLDILIHTYNRSALLKDCLESIFDANQSKTLICRVTVIDNNSSDDTRSVVEKFVHRDRLRVDYLFEKQQGRSAALNAGIRNSECSLIGMIDDDEQIDKKWIQVVEKWFMDVSVDFIGGPYFGLWRTKKPNWFPPEYRGVLSVDDAEELPREPVRFGETKEMLRGGNAVIRRSIFDLVGLYDVGLGRSGNGLGSCEDHDMFNKLINAKCNGVYVPNLIINHLVPSDRVTRAYFRRWAFGNGISLGRMDRQAPQKLVYVGRIPRYKIGSAAKGLFSIVWGSPSERFTAELRWWSLVGFVCGAYGQAGPGNASSTD